jgi:hypothetical protein
MYIASQKKKAGSYYTLSLVMKDLEPQNSPITTQVSWKYSITQVKAFWQLEILQDLNAW